MPPAHDGASPAPIDRSVLERMRSRFAGSSTFVSAEIVEEGKLHLRVELSSGYYPGSVSTHVEDRIETLWERQ